jgi:hypothetical protein
MRTQSPDRIECQAHKIERLLSTPQDVTGTPVDIKVTIPEQGLEPGDYTDASKEVADALTAMGFKWMWRMEELPRLTSGR